MMKADTRHRPQRITRAMARAQRGVVLIIALVVLVAMSLGGVAILRSVDTSTLIAGNYAFRQGALQGANMGIETAINWISQNQGNLTTDNTGAGYYSWASRLGTQRFKWEDSASWATAATVGADAAGNSVQYVIHRLCTQPGSAGATDALGNVTNPCATNIGSGSATAYDTPAEGSSNVGGASAFTAPTKMYLRVIARSVGPRNSVSYVQAMVLVAMN